MYDKPATDTYSLSGTVDNQNQQPLAGVTITFARQGGTDSVPAAVTTNSNGQWSQSGFEEGTPYQLTPSSANYTFTPASQNFSYDSMQPEVINLQAGGGSPDHHHQRHRTGERDELAGRKHGDDFLDLYRQLRING